jgi:hypothetical protein
VRHRLVLIEESKEVSSVPAIVPRELFETVHVQAVTLGNSINAPSPVSLTIRPLCCSTVDR